MAIILSDEQVDLEQCVRAYVRTAAALPAGLSESPRWRRFVGTCFRLKPEDREPVRSRTLKTELATYRARNFQPGLLIEGLISIRSIVAGFREYGLQRWTLVMHGTSTESPFGPCPAVAWCKGYDTAGLPFLCLDFQRTLPGYPDIPAFCFGVRSFDE